MANTLLFIVDLSLVVLALVLVKLILQSKRTPPLPPGPKGYPLIGNVLDMPTEREWLTFANWGDAWGDICSVTVMGQPIVVLNSRRVVCEILDKKSSIYSDRPVLQMGGELVGWKNTLVLLPYGDRFRRYRRLFHSLVGSHATIKSFLPMEEMETRRFLQRVLAKPEDLQTHIRKTAGAIILRISHGYEVKENNDPFIELADKATEQFSLATAPGRFLVDFVPALRYVPSWLPGAGFQKKAASWASTLSEMVERPHNFVKQQIAAGTAATSFSSTLLESKRLTDEEEFDLKWSAASLYAGASDTTVSAIYSFFLAMTLYPDVAKKAQGEIDSVVGNHRLPTYADREFLPYVDALVKEIFRWNTVVPTAVPHRAAQDDVQDGYFIPKGSLVIPNIWKLAHDPKVYDDPFTFKPERFIATGTRPAEPDPRQVCFGFGRRICPGLHLADVSVFISCVLSLAVFDITKCVENGIVVEPVHDSTTGTISHPKPFKCSIKPRSEKAVSLIQAAELK